MGRNGGWVMEGCHITNCYHDMIHTYSIDTTMGVYTVGVNHPHEP